MERGGPLSSTPDVTRHGITLPMDRIADFCRRWKIQRLDVFGSFLREDFQPESDLDFLCELRPEAEWSLEHLLAMDEELASIVGRHVDLVPRQSVERSRNYIRRRHILSTAETIYVEG